MSIIQDVLDELERAQEKFPTWPSDPVHAAAVVAEEAGELVKAVLQSTYEQAPFDNVRKEAIQTVAMALRFLASFDRDEYDWVPAPNHNDGENLTAAFSRVRD